MKDNRKMMMGIGGGILALCLLFLCVAGIASYFYWEDLSALLGLSQSQNTAQMLPEDTQLYFAMTPNLQNLAGYQNLEKVYLEDPDVMKLLDEFKAELKTETDLDFAEDIQPWLGNEIVLAMVNLTEAIEDSGATPLFVVAAATTDTAASDQFIQKILAAGEENGDPFVAETYQDVTLHVQGIEFGEDATVASFNDLVVISTDTAMVKDMIDRSQGNTEQPSLADNPRFQQVLSELPPEAVMTTYFDFSGLMDSFMAEIPVEVPTEQLQDLQAFEGMGMAGVLQPDGVQLDFAITYDAANLSERMKASLTQPASPNAVLNEIPADALMVYNANNLKAVWEQTRDSLDANPDFGETLQDLESEFGFSLDEDIFGWMTGEFAVVIVEAVPPNDFTPPVAGYLLIGTDDVNAASQGVQNVMGTLDEQGMLPPLDDVDINGIQVRGYTDFFSNDFQGGYGFHNGYFVVGYLEDSFTAFASASENSLNNSENFSMVQARLPQENYGYMYVDMDQTQTLLESQLSDFEREDYETMVRPFLDPVHAVGGSGQANASAEGVSKGSFFVLITE